MSQTSHLALHYHLRGDAHAMNAVIRNKCEAEALAAFMHIAQRLGIELTIETSAFEEGGLREIWRFAMKPEHGYTNVMVVLTLITNSFVSVWNAPPKPDKEEAGYAKEIARLTVEEKKLAVEKARVELQRLMGQVPDQAQTSTLVPAPPAGATLGDLPEPAPPAYQTPSRPPKGRDSTSVIVGATYYPALPSYSLDLRQPLPTISKPAIAVLAQDTRFTTRRSNFFKALVGYDKVTAVGWSVNVEDQVIEQTVEKRDFAKFILMTDKLPLQVVAEAVIQIAAPVITDSGLHWKGFYQGEPISFAMQDAAFKDMVKQRAVSFQAGNAIRCRLEIERKLDEVGEPIVTGYSVPVVIEMLDKTGATETPQGKKQRFYDKHSKDQGGLFDGEHGA